MIVHFNIPIILSFETALKNIKIYKIYLVDFLNDNFRTWYQGFNDEMIPWGVD